MAENGSRMSEIEIEIVQKKLPPPPPPQNPRDQQAPQTRGGGGWRRGSCGSTKDELQKEVFCLQQIWCWQKHEREHKAKSTESEVFTTHSSYRPSVGDILIKLISRFSMPYGKIVDCWQRENVMPAMPEEEYPIYQSASFRRLLFVLFCCCCYCSYFWCLCCCCCSWRLLLLCMLLFFLTVVVLLFYSCCSSS